MTATATPAPGLVPPRFGPCPICYGTGIYKGKQCAVCLGSGTAICVDCDPGTPVSGVRYVCQTCGTERLAHRISVTAAESDQGPAAPPPSN